MGPGPENRTARGRKKGTCRLGFGGTQSKRDVPPPIMLDVDEASIQSSLARAKAFAKARAASAASSSNMTEDKDDDQRTKSRSPSSSRRPSEECPAVRASDSPSLPFVSSVAASASGSSLVPDPALAPSPASVLLVPRSALALVSALNPVPPVDLDPNLAAAARQIPLSLPVGGGWVEWPAPSLNQFSNDWVGRAKFAHAISKWSRAATEWCPHGWLPEFCDDCGGCSTEI